MPTASSASPDEFRESLSAWHDDALPEDASRFVLKRLLQDEALRAEVGRWQAIGDTLRRQSVQAAAPDLAARIGAAIDAEGRASAAAPRLRWWATAAAVGLAAVLMLPGRDAVDDAVQGPGAPSLAAVGSDRPVDVPISPIVRSPPRPLLALQRADLEPAARVASVPPLVRAPQPTAEQLAPLPAIDAPSRPWPRSSGAQDAFTVDFAPPTGDVAPRP
jgi:hypothetical protein